MRTTLYLSYRRKSTGIPHLLRRCRLLKPESPLISLFYPNRTEMLVARNLEFFIVERYLHDRVVGDNRDVVGDRQYFEVVLAKLLQRKFRHHPDDLFPVAQLPID